MTPDLERELRALQIDWPATPDVAASVRARIAGETPGVRPLVFHRWSWQPGWAHALAVLVAAFAVVMAASPSARSAILELLGLESVRIERREPAATPRPVTSIGRDLGLGEPVTLAQARQRLDFAVAVPRALGEPDAVFLGVLPTGADALHLVYGEARTGVPASPHTGASLLISQFPASFGPLIEKALGGAAEARRLDLGGDPGYFLEGAHGFGFVDPDGTRSGFEEQRLAGNTLLVERGGMLIRIEGDISQRRALEVFRSLEALP